MPGTNTLAVDIVAKTDGLTAGLTKAKAQVEAFTQAVNKSSDAQAVAAGEQAIAKSAQTTAQAWVASRMAMIEAENRATTLLKAGRKADVSSLSDALTQMDQRHDAFLATTRAYYDGLNSTQAASFAAQEAAANKEIESEYQRLAARLDDATAVEADTAALAENTVALHFNATAMRETGFAASELATGRYGRLETSLLSVANRVGLMQKLLSPMGIAFGVGAAAVATMTGALIEGERQTSAYESAILSTGNVATMMAGDLDAMSVSLAQGNTTIGTARKAVLALAQSGEFAGDSLRQAAQGAIDFASVTGQSMKEASSAVESFAKDPARAVEELNRQYHFLTIAQAENIAELQREGDTYGASQAAISAFAQTFHQRAAQVVADEGWMLRGAHEFEHQWSSLWHAMEHPVVGGLQGLKDRLAYLQNQDRTYGGTATDRAEIARLQAEIKVAEQKRKTAAEQQRINDAGVRAAQFLEKQISGLKSVNAALEHERQLTSQIEALHKASPSDKLLKGDVFDKSGHLTKGNATYAALIAKIQHEFDAHPVHIRVAKSLSDTVGEELLKEQQKIANQLPALMQRSQAEQNAIEEKGAQTAEQILQVRAQGTKQVLDEAVAAGHMSAAQREMIERQLTNALYREDMQRLQHELAMLSPGTAAYQQVADQIEMLQAQHYQKLEALDLKYQQAQRKQQQQEVAERQKTVRKIESVEDQMLSGLISGRMNWASFERRIFQQLAAAEIEMALHAATERLIVGKAADAQERATKSSLGLASIESDAAQAAAGAYKAMVGIPYVGPILAPIAAGVAFAAVGAYKSLVSFDVGSWNVPGDMMAMVHKNETILPRPFADDFRAAVSGSGGIIGGGDTHLHVHATDAESVRRLFLTHSDAIGAAVRKAARNGVLA